MVKVFILKEEAERSLTYLRSFWNDEYYDPNARLNCVDACYIAIDKAASIVTEDLKYKTTEAIRMIASLVAQYKSTNSKFWEVLSYFDIYPKEV